MLVAVRVVFATNDSTSNQMVSVPWLARQGE